MSIGTLHLLFTAQNSENRDELFNVAIAQTTGAIWVYPSNSPSLPAERQVWLAEMTPPPDPPISLGKFRHFKGGAYRALFLAHSAHKPEEPYVIYFSTTYGAMWCRPASMWTEETDRWPDGKVRSRFVPETVEVAALFSR